MQTRHRTAHARIWMLLAIILPLLLVYALISKQTLPIDRPAVQIEKPGRDQRLNRGADAS